IYFPKGEWISLEDREIIKGPCVKKLKVLLEKIPVFVKKGAIIPSFPVKENLSFKPDEIELNIFPDKETDFIYYEDDGLTEEYLEGKYLTQKISVTKSKKEIKVVYKPQQLSGMTKFSKTVSELLNDEMIKNFDLENCKNRRIDELSGGELQRLAIAVAASKDADIYYFDEPSSYLDVKQRLNMAKHLRELGKEKYVMVVEHDLATLDFLADRIHIFYGKPGVFGIVSKPYTVRNGINIFLHGYIAEDNVRIREPIIFEETGIEKGVKKDILITFSNIKKKYVNGFELNISSGEIYKNEVLGVFGANALGKTTFAKILAGEIDYDGEISKNIKISYKPQYLEIKYDGTVFELFSTVENERKDILIRQLDLEKLMEKKIKNLSGGELQRIAIALCLLKDCDLYLLDEPSAYLDVDQRLAVAKAIRESGTTMVIDHDLLFLSYIADRAMVFTGEPGIRGFAECMSLRNGFNKFLKEIGITFRRDNETKRPRANKPGSVKDREQKTSGEYFF
ncbi:MAG: ribosome biogenesis/translation initiation ATPase RLI, partial [Candidatus Aenigmatarchaeota archaeon]